MRPLSDPAAGPSRLAYRLRRLWALAWVRSLALVYLPIAGLALAAWAVVSTDRLRLAIEAEIAAVAKEIAARPEFTVRGVEVNGAGPGLEAVLRAVVGPVKGQSSLRLDLAALRRDIKGLGEVAQAALYFDAAGILVINVTERVPVALWRDPDRRLWLVDGDGVIVAEAGRRARHPDLPLTVGLGALGRVAEIAELLAAAPALRPRIRGFARQGMRRWDVILDRGLTIKLPEVGAARALAGAMGLHYGDELMARDLVSVDLRVPGRPTLRLSPRAAETDVIRRAVDLVMGEDT